MSVIRRRAKAEIKPTDTIGGHYWVVTVEDGRVRFKVGCNSITMSMKEYIIFRRLIDEIELTLNCEALMRSTMLKPSA